MSHDATNWAIKQRGIKPALKVVLWNLCDRYHPDNGCFPSQETLANDCEVPRSTLNTYLDQLEGAGLILRIQRRKAGSQRQERTRYYFPFEPDFAAKLTEKPSPETGHGIALAESRNDGEPSPENGESRVQNLDSNLVREPVKEPVNERERERGDEGEENPKAMEKDFRKFFFGWKTAISDSVPDARREWQKLTAEERSAAMERSADYQETALSTGRKYLCSSATYLKEKRWEKLGEKATALPVAPERHNPYSRAWAALRMAELSKPVMTLRLSPLEERILDGKPEKADVIWRDKREKEGWPDAVKLNEAARDRRPVLVPARIVAISASFDKVAVGGDIWEAWKRLHHERFWPWMPEPNGLPFVQFPALPDGIDDPDEAVAQALRNFQRQLIERRDDDAA